jgi:hypothetical protein
MNSSAFWLPFLIAIALLIARSKSKWSTTKLTLASVALSLIVMFILIGVFPALDTRAFGKVMG